MPGSAARPLGRARLPGTSRGLCCGVAGSGKSTVAKLVASKLGYKHYSMGDLQRMYAKEKGITIEELGELEAKDPTIDKEVDASQTKLSQKEDNFVIEGWIAYHFIPNSKKIFLEVDENIGTKRIFENQRPDERLCKTLE
ncbi:MAG: AAA family ATPase, partial [Candidatus Marinimicrobia bacterium]|nr:AAA family ATPase [Candidatus Neomarinimicrobiota bacterium]